MKNQEATTSGDKNGRDKSASSGKNVKNLHKEVEIIFSMEESDEKVDTVSKIATTPKRGPTTRNEQPKTPRSVAVVLQETLQTPRRSARKSIKPSQEYEDIVGGGNKRLRSTVKENDVDEQQEEEAQPPQPKWTPAKVGRVSQKRTKRNRKTREGAKNAAKMMEVQKATASKDCTEDCTVEVQEVKEQTVEVQKQSVECVTEAEEVANEMEELMEIKETEAEVKESETAFKEAIKCNSPKSELEPEATMQSSEHDAVTLAAGENSQNVEENTNDSKLKNDEKFGSYLKSKTLDISDLGLNPLQADTELDVEELPPHNEQEEMASLIICDDEELDEEETNQEKAAPLEILNLNETFNASDCMIVVPPEDDAESVMEALQISDDENENATELKASSPVKELPKVMLTNSEGLSETLVSSCAAPGTPQQLRPKAYRFPTPYKTKENFKFSKQGKEAAGENVLQSSAEASAASSSMIVLSTLEPKEFVLRSIRKRSLSVCIDGKQQPPQKERGVINRVTFYSPANQTAVIEDLDELIAKSTKKLAIANAANKDNNVTKRRKRSMSFDESILSRPSKLPRPVMVRPNTPNKQRQTPQKPAPTATRIKLPNFAAIHQKHFNKMENLVEHVTRKAERAKEILNSTGKGPRPVSAQKGLPTRNQNEATAKSRDKPKALKKIELQDIVTTKPATVAVAPTVLKTVAPLKISDGLNLSTLLPNPRLAIIKPLPAPTIPRRKPAATTSQATPSKRVLRPTTQLLTAATATAAASTKPAFNLSTHVLQAPTIFSASDAATAAASSVSAVTSLENKIASRRKRHMEMFKGRSDETRTGRNDGVTIRGVRSNRRFELQMAHRRNLEQN